MKVGEPALYRVTVSVEASNELTIVHRVFVEAFDDEEAEAEAKLELLRRWKVAEASRYQTRAIERGAFTVTP